MAELRSLVNSRRRMDRSASNTGSRVDAIASRWSIKSPIILVRRSDGIDRKHRHRTGIVRAMHVDSLTGAEELHTNGWGMLLWTSLCSECNRSASAHPVDETLPQSACLYSGD